MCGASLAEYVCIGDRDEKFLVNMFCVTICHAEYPISGSDTHFEKKVFSYNVPFLTYDGIYRRHFAVSQ